MPPEVMPPEVMQQIVKVEKLVGEMKTMAYGEIGQNILEYAAIAAGHAREAKTSCALALVSAWVCGVGLNRMKDTLLHGEFGKWRAENIENCRVSKRSSTRYMQLAAAYGSVRDLLASSQGLTKAYIACGILPDNSPTEQSGAKEKPHPTAVLYTGVRKLHESLDLFTKTLDAFGKSKEELSSEDKRQLILIKNELSEFLHRIMEQLP